MNSQQVFNAMCAAMIGLNDEEWFVVVDNQIDAMPEKLDFCTPFEVGKLDAEEELELDPTRHGLITVGECEEYILGYREGQAADLAGYCDDIEDRNFWAKGQW